MSCFFFLTPHSPVILSWWICDTTLANHNLRFSEVEIKCSSSVTVSDFLIVLKHGGGKSPPALLGVLMLSL